jgi:Uma2 family endonuclease
MAATTTLVSLEEYLRTSYHPDRDFVDGQVEERNLGEFEHARLQSLLIGWFLSHEKDWNIVTVVEQRIRVAAKRVRIADICLLHRSAPREQVTQTPPLLCIEMLSPEDRLPRAAKVMDDYARMGVANLWLLDPVDRIGYVYTAGGLLKLTEDRLSIPSSAIYLDLPGLFAGLY